MLKTEKQVKLIRLQQQKIEPSHKKGDIGLKSIALRILYVKTPCFLEKQP
jgi:hypothetical protein